MVRMDRLEKALWWLCDPPHAVMNGSSSALGKPCASVDAQAAIRAENVGVATARSPDGSTSAPKAPATIGCRTTIVGKRPVRRPRAASLQDGGKRDFSAVFSPGREKGGVRGDILQRSFFRRSVTRPTATGHADRNISFQELRP